jgi:VWFA-related protein
MSESRVRFTRRRFLLGATALPALAQDEATFSIGVNVTNVLATVKDKNGHVIHDLTREDFELDEDGRRQEIRYFTARADLPLTIGILVDISGSQTGVIQEESRASFQFLDQVLREGQDRAFLFRFYRRAEMLLYLSGSRAELRAGLSRLGDPKVGMDGTALNDTIKIASGTIMSKQQGRKALIVLSDGVDTGSSTTLAAAIASAQLADTLIYCLGFYEDGDGGGYGRFGGGRTGESVLKQLAKQTGGGYFEISSKQNAEKAFRQIEDELRNQYSLGYESDGTLPGFRKIHVAVHRKDLKDLKDLKVQAREGYWAQN